MGGVEKLWPGDVYKNGVFVANGIWSDLPTAGTSVAVTRANPGGGDTSAHGWIPAYTGPDTVVSIKLYAHIVASQTPSVASVPVGASVVFANPGGGGSTPFSDVAFTVDVPGDGLGHILEFDADYGTFGLSMADVVARLRGGSGVTTGMRAIRFTPGLTGSIPSGSSRTITIYEAAIEIEWRSPNPSPLRLYPRSDGRSGPKRLYPPPPSRRVAGGYH